MPHSIVPCPHCGGDIDADATVCRHCGSSDSDGWRETESDELDDDFDYDEFVREEFSDSRFSTNVNPFWWWIAMLILIAAGGFYLLSVLQLFQ